MILRIKRLSITLMLALLCASCPAYAYAVDADTQQFYTDVNAWLSTINGHLGVISADVTDILQEVSNGLTASVNVASIWTYQLPQGGTVAQVLSANNSYLGQLAYYLNSIDTHVANILSYNVPNTDVYLTLPKMVYGMYRQS